MCAKMIIVVSCLVLSSSMAIGLRYDQSQNGDLNVQVDLKGLNIIALMKGGKEEYVDYDYAYDYSEMTIKPEGGSTLKPLNTTTSGPQNETTTASVELPYESTTIATSSPNAVTDFVTDANTQVTSTEKITDSKVTNVSAEPQIASSVSPVSSTSPATTGCKKGFALNQKGECELKLQNASTNALLKLVRLSQKLKLRRERTRTKATEKTTIGEKED